MNKPIYKKVWFWLVIVLVGGAIIAGTTRTQNGTIQNKIEEQEKKAENKNEAKIGDTISFDGVEYILTNQQSKNGVLGDKIITFDVTIKNPTSSSKFITSSIFKLIDESGAVLDSTFTDKTNQLFKELPAGTNSSGEIAFKDNGKKLKEIQMTQIGQSTVVIKL
jgi:hypothetical protein